MGRLFSLTVLIWVLATGAWAQGFSGLARIDAGASRATDAGQGAHYTPPYPAHYILHGAGKFGLQCLCGLDQLPPTGAVLIATPLKIKGGTGSPLRVLALVPEGET